MSLFLPLVILCIAFYFLGSQSQVDYLRIFICGLAFGGIVGLMHYSYATFSFATAAGAHRQNCADDQGFFGICPWLYRVQCLFPSFFRGAL